MKGLEGLKEPMERLAKATGNEDVLEEETINCACDDKQCPKQGIEGEVAYHVENCSCQKCHDFMGKL